MKVITCVYLPSDSNSFIDKTQVINKSFYKLRFDFCAVICCRITLSGTFIKSDSVMLLHIIFCPQVKPAPANNDISGLVVGNNSEFNQLVQSGNVKVATQLANAVLQTVEQSDTTATKDKIAVGSNIILIL